MLKLLLIPLFLYLALCLLLFALQTRILFPTGAVGEAGPLPPGAERLVLDVGDGVRLAGVRIPTAPGIPPSGTLVLGFGGNGWNGAEAARYLHALYPQAEIVAFHYRGYRPSGGGPSAAALLDDAVRVHDLAVRVVKPRRVVAAGFSVGSGVAAHLAAQRPLAGLILVTPYDSLSAVAAGHYPWLPVRLLFRHPMEPARELKGVKVPTAIVSAARDTLVPAERTDALRRAVPNLVFDRAIPGAGHNDIYQRDAFQQAMREAMAAIAGAAAAAR